MVIGRDLTQYVGRDIGIDNDLFPGCRQLDQLQDLNFHALIGDLTAPVPMLLRGHTEPFLPPAHRIKIA